MCPTVEFNTPKQCFLNTYKCIIMAAVHYSLISPLPPFKAASAPENPGVSGGFHSNVCPDCPVEPNRDACRCSQFHKMWGPEDIRFDLEGGAKNTLNRQKCTYRHIFPFKITCYYCVTGVLLGTPPQIWESLNIFGRSIKKVVCISGFLGQNSTRQCWFSTLIYFKTKENSGPRGNHRAKPHISPFSFQIQVTWENIGNTGT